jgi:hypothetical protein
LGDAASTIACVGDANPLKAGKLLPGTRLPIVTPQHMAARKPDVILLLAWTLATEIEAVLAGLGLAGRQMATAVPRLVLREIGA